MALPTTPIAVYHKASNWYSMTRRLVDLPQTYNVLFLFQAVPTEAVSTTGKFLFTPASNTTQAQLNQDIATCRARGQQVILTIGGAGAQVSVFNQIQADNFVQSVKDAYNQFGGIDGIDLNTFEQVQNPAIKAWLPYACGKIKEHFGANFLITAPPSATHFQDQAKLDRDLLVSLQSIGALDWFCPQFYDGPGLNTLTQIKTMLAFYGEVLPASKIGVGFGIAGTGFPTSSVAANWWKSPAALEAYKGVTARGAFNFASDLDQTDTFATAFATLQPPPVIIPPPSGITLPFSYGFNTTGTLEENPVLSNSSSPYFWVNSGAYLFIKNGVGETIHGDLSPTNKWYAPYSTNVSADFGKHPQNIFRLYTKTKFRDVEQIVSFRMDKYNLSSAPERKASNGLCIMHRDIGNGDTLYHTILRVDGTLMVKRKVNGVYSEAIGPVKIFPGTWHISNNPNLIPLNTWIRMKASTQNEGAGVRIKVALDVGNTGTFTDYINILDTGDSMGSPIVTEGLCGIRTDFADVSFDNWNITAVGAPVPPIPPVDLFLAGQKDLAKKVYDIIKPYL